MSTQVTRGGAASAHVDEGQGDPNKWLIAGSISFGAVMATIDASIVNVAMPHIRGSVGATIEEITWITTGYIIAMVLVMPLTGILGALWGQKELYLGSLVLFVVGSIMCGMARTLPMLVFCRVVQGFGAGSLQPSQQAILRQAFPQREQGMAMAIMGMVVTIGPALGPTMGGWITDNYSWPWIFYINLPVGIVGIFMTWRNVHEPADIREANITRGDALRKNFDWAGIILTAISISTLQYVLEEGPSKDWLESNVILICSAIAGVTMVALVIRELTAENPVINLRLFRDRTFLAGTVISGVMFAMLMGSMFLLPIFTQEMLGYTATLSGLLLLPRALVMMVGNPIIGRLYNTVPPAITVACGVVLFVIGSFMLSHVSIEMSAWNFFVPLAITGFGFSCLFVPLTTAALSSIPRKDLADAAGLNSFVRQIGGSVGLTIFATLLTRFAVRATATLSWHITPLNPMVSHQIAAMAARVADHGLGRIGSYALALKIMGGRVAAQGMVLAFEKSFLLQGIAFLAVLPLLFWLRVERHGHDKASTHRPSVDISME